MWIFITARLRQWLFFAVAIPLLTTLVHLIRQIIERRSGETSLSRALRQVENLGRRKKKK